MHWNVSVHTTAFIPPMDVYDIPMAETTIRDIQVGIPVETSKDIAGPNNTVPTYRIYRMICMTAPYHLRVGEPNLISRYSWMLITFNG